MVESDAKSYFQLPTRGKDPEERPPSPSQLDKARDGESAADEIPEEKESRESTASTTLARSSSIRERQTGQSVLLVEDNDINMRVSHRNL